MCVENMQVCVYETLSKWYFSVEKGLNTIERKSEDTPVTVPYENIFGDGDAFKTDNSSYDRCGWPNHMLVPKGSAEGFHSQLFVMISDYETDKVSMETKFIIYILYLLQF